MDKTITADLYHIEHDES